MAEVWAPFVAEVDSIAHTVTDVPKGMNDDVEFLSFMNCGGHLNYLDASVIWMSRGGSFSVVHYDDQDIREPNLTIASMTKPHFFSCINNISYDSISFILKGPALTGPPGTPVLTDTVNSISNR